MSDAYVDDRTPEEKAAGRAKIRAWLDNLPPSIAKIYADLKRMDPKGFPQHKAAGADRPDPSDLDGLRAETPRDPITPEDR